MCEKEKMIYCTAERWFKGYPFQVLKISKTKYIQQLHYHDYMQIWYVKKGQCAHYLDNVEYQLSKGDIFILPPFVPHKIISEDAEGTELLSCGFQTDFISDKEDFNWGYLAPFVQNIGDIKPFFALDGSTIKEVEKIFDEITYEYERKEKLFELYVKADILKLLSIIARKYNKSSYTDKNSLLKHRGVIMEVLDYMQKHSKEKIYIEDACAIANMTPTYFSNVFKQLTGQTFVEYLRSLKIANAKEILLNSEKRISDISVEIGFGDPAYFDRVFKKEVGMSPGQFRAVYYQSETDEKL